MPKPCNYCNSTWHASIFCYQAPKKAIKVSRPLPLPTKPIAKTGTQHKKWAKYRLAWKKKHLNDTKHCHICGKYLAEGTFTLDHVIPRSRRPDLVFDDSNIKPACWTCNSEKASRVL